MGTLSKIKSLLFNIRPALQFSKGTSKHSSIPGACIYYLSFLYNAVFLPDIKLSSHTSYWRAFQMAHDEKDRCHLFPKCTAICLYTRIHFFSDVFFRVRALECLYFLQNLCTTYWCEGQEVDRNYTSAQVWLRCCRCKTMEMWQHMRHMGQRQFPQLCLRKIQRGWRYNSETRLPTPQKEKDLTYLVNAFLGNLKLVWGCRIIIIVFQQ